MKKGYIFGLIMLVTICLVGLLLLSTKAQAASIIDSGTCGAQGDNLTWAMDSNGTLTISGTGAMNNYAGGTVAEPDMPWAGYRSFIKSIVIEKGVRSIGDGAFYKCDKVTTVTISDGVVSVGRYAFQECYRLTDITLPGSARSYGFWAFEGCSSLSNVYYSGDFADWCRIAFGDIVDAANPMSYAQNLYINGKKLSGMVEIPEGVTAIPDHTFKNSQITSLSLPASFTEMGSVGWVESLAAVYVDGGNEKYSSEGGIVYNKKKTLIEFVPLGLTGNVSLSSSLVLIGDYMFFKCDKLTGVSVPESVISIGEGAFAACDNLAVIIIPNSVTSIGSNAFNKEDSSECFLDHILYKGTEKQWDSIDIAEYNDDFRNVIRHYSCTGDEIVDGVCSVCCANCTHEWNKGTVTKKATCKEAGVMTYTCTVCDEVTTEAIAKLTTHTYDNACDTSCNVCGGTRTVTHQYDRNWSKNESSHWHPCTICGNKADQSSHTPGAAATETTAQTCTTCGYVIQAALGHTHKYSTEWNKDVSGHWYSCACGSQKGYAAHNYKNSCDAECDACGYTRTITHTPGAAATATTDQVCTVCGKVLAKATGETESTTPPTEATTPPTETPIEPETEPATEPSVPETTEPPSADEPTEPENTTAAPTEPVNDTQKDGGFSIWIPIVVVLIAGGAAAGVIIWKKKH